MLSDILKHQNHLRIGQVGALCALQSHFLGVHRNSAAQIHLPTGYGKTLVMLLAQVMFGGDGQTVVVCGTEILRVQLSDNFQKLYGEYQGSAVVSTGIAARQVLGSSAPKKAKNQQIYQKVGKSASSEPPADAKVVVAHPASLETYAPTKVDHTSGDKVGLVKLILIDEGHHAAAKTWFQVIANNPDAKVISFTATPFRRDHQQLAGRIVFSYSLADAIDEDAVVDAEIHRLPATVGANESPAQVADRKSKEIAKRTLALLKAQKANNSGAGALIKCGSVAQANNLASIYKSLMKTSANDLLILHSKLGAQAFRAAVDRLQIRDYSVLISVDMLAEGFDQDNLEVLAIHDRVADFGHFVQVAGRVTRSKSAVSHVVVCEDDLPVELQAKPQLTHLKELSDALRRAISRQEMRGELLTAIEDGAVPSAMLAAALDDLQLSKHTIALTVDEKANGPASAMMFPNVEEVIGDAELIGIHQAALSKGHIWVAIVKAPDPRHWLGDLDGVAYNHGLLVAYLPRESAKVKRRLLFVSASADHRYCLQELVTLLSRTHRLRPVPLINLKSAFSKPDRVNYYNVGLRSRMPSPLVERYRIITGKEVEVALDGETARGFSQGHLMGKMFTKSGSDVMTEVLGVSSNGVLWAAGSESPTALCESWLQGIAELITSGTKPLPTALEMLPAAEMLNIASLTSGKGILGVWGIVSIEAQQKLFGGGQSPWAMTLSDAFIEDIDVAPAAGKISFRIRGEAELLDGSGLSAVNELVEMSEGPSFQPVTAGLEIAAASSNARTALSQHLKKDPPLLYLGDGSTVQGDTYAPPPTGMNFDFLKGTLFVANWSNCDPTKEKPPGFEPPKPRPANAPAHIKPVNFDPAADWTNSIFKLVAEELVALVNAKRLDFVVCDDDSYEMADFVAGRRTSPTSSLIQFYLCKRRTAAPGMRTGDVAELWAQALRTAQLLTPDTLLERFRSRKLNRMKLLPTVAESRVIAEDLLKPGMDVTFEVILVQPGVDVAKLLATSPDAPGAKSTVNHAFVSVAALFQRRGVKLLVVGDVTPPAAKGKKQTMNAKKAAVAAVAPPPPTFVDIFRRPF